MAEPVKTEQMQLGPGFVLKAIKELGVPTVLLCLLAVAIYLLWKVDRQDLRDLMTAASAERTVIYQRHAEERAVTSKQMQELQDLLAKVRRDVRRDKNCKTDED